MKGKYMWVMIGVLVALSMLLMSCGGSTTTTAPTTAPTTAAAPQTSAAPTISAAPPKTTPPAVSQRPTEQAVPATSVAAATTTAAAPTGATPKKGGVLTIITGGPMNFGLPWAGITPPDLFYACPAVENLLRTDKEGVPIPWLATGWVVAPDYKSITFTLRKGVKFHDGTDFNAAALKYNFEAQAKSPMPDLKAITSVDVVDDYTAKVNLSVYQPHFFSILATGRAGWIVSPTAAGKMTADEMKIHPVGTGPFKFEEFKRDAFVKFSRFDQYWQPGKPYLDGVQYDIIVDPVSAMMAFKSGKEEVHWNPTPKEAADLKAQGYVVSSAQASIYQWIPDSLNTDSPWSNLKVRQAGQYAIDTVSMAKAEGFGWADPYWNQVFPKGNPAYDPTIVGYPYNPGKAKQLLAEAGYPNGFKTTLLTTTPPLGDFEIATQNYLKQVGIQAELKPLPPPAYMAMNQQGWKNGLYRSQSVASLGADPGYQMAQYLSTPPNYWVSVVRPKSVQDLINSSSSERDPVKRVDLFKQLSKTIIDDHALIISVWGGYLVSAKQKDVMGDTIHALWTMNWTPEDAWLNK
jgi:peptide/nickel transport system substrate-binding protein